MGKTGPASKTKLKESTGRGGFSRRPMMRETRSPTGVGASQEASAVLADRCENGFLIAANAGRTTCPVRARGVEGERERERARECLNKTNRRTKTYMYKLSILQTFFFYPRH